MPKLVDHTGKRFGRLTVIRRLKEKGSARKARWECLCDCGTISYPAAYDLVSEKTKSCGCFHKDAIISLSTSHGLHGSPEYLAWKGMIGRCYNTNGKSFHRYGGRGIEVCPQWRASFPAFLSDVGHRPSPLHSLDRENNDGNYEPSNCRWATRRQQCNNKNNNRRITIAGTTMSVTEAARTFKLNPASLYQKVLKRGAFDMDFCSEASLRQFYKNRNDTGRGEA